MMNPLKLLDDFFSRDERLQIQNLKKMLKECKEQCTEITENLHQKEKELEVKNKKIAELKSKISALNESLRNIEISGVREKRWNPPEWLDTKYVPFVPRVHLIWNNNVEEEIRMDLLDFYVVSPSLVKVVQDHKWWEMEHDEKLMKIWEFVIKELRYRYDKGEDWRFPQVTLNARRGDCEDGTILFVTLCRIAGVPPAHVFNACGWYYSGSNKFGHSFPIAKMSDGKWYVFETTLDWVPSKPKLFKGSNYSADWGVSNWLWKGRIKPQYVLNGKYQV